MSVLSFLSIYFLTVPTELYSEHYSPFLFFLFFPNTCLWTLSPAFMRGRSVSAFIGIEFLLGFSSSYFFFASSSNSWAIFSRLLKLRSEVLGLSIPDKIVALLSPFPYFLTSMAWNYCNIFLRIDYYSVIAFFYSL